MRETIQIVIQQLSYTFSVGIFECVVLLTSLLLDPVVIPATYPPGAPVLSKKRPHTV